MSKYKRIIGSRAILLETTTNKAGITINSGEAVTIKGSYIGYEIETDDLSHAFHAIMLELLE